MKLPNSIDPNAFPDQHFDGAAALDPKTLFHGINTGQPVIVAVSGGSDSIALLVLAATWAKLKKVDLFAVTVDHGLRPEAAAEAAFVAGVCEALEVTHVTLAWEGMKPHAGISQAARNARYVLLEEFAGEVGARTILCGHTADDQAETLYMRLEREKETGTGRGLSGMARVTLLSGGVRLVRPLLSASRQNLRQYLASHAQSWIEDPTNQDMAYERVRVRHKLALDPVHKQRLVAFANVMGKRRKLLSQAAAKELGTRVSLKSGCVFKMKTGGLLKLNSAVYNYALQILLASVGGNEYLPSPQKFGPLIEAIRISHEKDFRQRLTLSGCVIDVKPGELTLYREVRNLPAVLLGAGDSIIWDGRLAVSNRSSTSLYIGPFEPSLLGETEDALCISIEVSPKAALGSLPIMRADGDERYLPTYGKRNLPKGVTARITCQAIESFCPEYDFAPLEWLREIDLKASEVRSKTGD